MQLFNILTVHITKHLATCGSHDFNIISFNFFTSKSLNLIKVLSCVVINTDHM